MATVGYASILAMAIVLAFSAAQKAVVGGSVRPILQDLGFTTGVSRLLSYLLVILEATAVIFLTIAPGWLATYLLVLMLAASFSIAGILALLRKYDIKCNCFGASSSAKLGWAQVLVLPLWLVASWLGYTSSWHPDPTVGLAVLSGVVLSVGITKCARMEYLRRQLRWDRFATAA